ncbi:MAG: RHS repeat domain-containing protein, partial [Victivallaceae bacterium]
MISCSRQNYKYDMKGQLLAVVDASGKAVEQYVYDPAGNILKKTIDGKATTYMYDKANQLVSSSADGVDTDFAYDAAGRLATETVGAADNNALRRTEYAYGWLDKVMSVSEKNNNAVSRTDFEYGIDNQLSSRTDATGKSESFLWDGLALIARGENNYLNEPAITGGNPILAFSKDSSKVLFDDMLGNTLGSLEGGKFSAIQRSAFGEKLSNSSTSELS